MLNQKIYGGIRPLNTTNLHDSFVARELEGKLDVSTLTLLADSYRHAGDLAMANRLDNLAAFFTT